jgi:hypothetical protein
MSPSDRVTKLYPQAPGSFFVAFYESQDYGGVILTRLKNRDVLQILQYNVFSISCFSNSTLQKI